MMATLKQLKKTFQARADKTRALSTSAYFKTGKGEYGEGDIFLGISVPERQKIVRGFLDLGYADLDTLLKSRFHEYRSSALQILETKFEKADKVEQKKIVTFYLAHADRINNWDLVDMSVREILGAWYYKVEKEKVLKFFLKLARSKNIWERRMAIVATHAFIVKGDMVPTFAVTEALMKDKHDLVHKACGWMLREVGKKDQKKLKTFLEKHAAVMPRTMLRYSIEHFTPAERQYYMRKKSVV